MPTSNKDMADMMRKRRAEMAAMPDDSSYSGPPSASEPANDTDTATESTEKFTVATPGTPGVDGEFEYEPFLDTPGAWVVYPPGVPCDDTQYRIQMPEPAQPDDFAEMQKALTDAGDTSGPAGNGTAPSSRSTTGSAASSDTGAASGSGAGY